MGFREILPSRSNSSFNTSDAVRVSFPKMISTGKSNMSMYIGINIAKKLDFKDGDKISFSVDEDDPKIWLLKKALNNVGYKLRGSKQNKTLTNLRLQMIWRQYVPEAQETPVRDVKYDMYAGGLRVFAGL